MSGQRETRCRGALARALLVLCAVVPATVGAVPVTFDFTGDVVSVIPGTGLFGVVPGDTVTGSYTFDTTLFRFATPFKLDSDSNQAGSAGVFDITINAGGVTRSTSDNARIFGGSLPPLHTVLFQDGGVFTAGIDRFTMQARTSTSGDDSAFLSLSDTLPDPEADGISPGAGNLTPALMLTAPDVSLFTTTDVNFFTARDASGNLEGDIRFRLTSIVAASNGGDPGAAFLPTSGGNGDPFSFLDAPGGGFWFDPPAASGFTYQTTDSSNFTQVRLPGVGSVPDADASYLVSSINGVQIVAAGDRLDFAVPVDVFTVTGINPSVDGGDPLAFPTFLAFDQAFADFTMTPIAAAPPDPTAAPEPGALALALLGFFPLAFRSSSRRGH